MGLIACTGLSGMAIARGQASAQGTGQRKQVCQQVSAQLGYARHVAIASQVSSAPQDSTHDWHDTPHDRYCVSQSQWVWIPVGHPLQVQN